MQTAECRMMNFEPQKYDRRRTSTSKFDILRFKTLSRIPGLCQLPGLLPLAWKSQVSIASGGAGLNNL
jgi:hypothetical protein